MSPNVHEAPGPPEEHQIYLDHKKKSTTQADPRGSWWRRKGKVREAESPSWPILLAPMGLCPGEIRGAVRKPISRKTILEPWGYLKPGQGFAPPAGLAPVRVGPARLGRQDYQEKFQTAPARVKRNWRPGGRGREAGRRKPRKTDPSSSPAGRFFHEVYLPGPTRGTTLQTPLYPHPATPASSPKKQGNHRTAPERDRAVG